jgi:hypothetical protein
LVRQAVRLPSRTVHALFTGCENEKTKKLLRDALLPTGLLQHDNGRNTVNPGEPIHHH